MVLAVATPRWRHSTLVCTAMSSAVLASPSPTPNNALRACGTCRLTSGRSRRASATAAAAEMARPDRTSTRKPTRGSALPLIALAIGHPITIGVIALPASVGEPPRTPWTYSGT